MGLMDRLLGRSGDDEQQRAGQADAQPLTDEQAIERYRYMLRTAPPEDIERAHEEAFAKLTPEQRRLVLEQLSAQVPPGERARSDSPRDLARMATRAEIREPGTMERTFGGPAYGGPVYGGYAGPGLGSMFLTTLAASFVGTAIAQSFFASGAFGDGYGQGYDAGYEEGREGAEGSEGDQTGVGEGDYGGGEYGGETGYGSEADLGGSDFGGGDFGGGDFGGGGF